MAKDELLKFIGKIVGERTTSSSETTAAFALKEKGLYTFVASHPDFLSGTEKEADLSSTPPESVISLDFELEKCRPEKCGVLKAPLFKPRALALCEALSHIFMISF